MIAARAIDRPCTFLNERARIVTTQSTVSAPTRRAIVWRWRVVDIVVAAVIGVAAGVVFWAFGLAYSIPGDALGAILPGAQGLLYGVWLFAGVLGGIIIRKPGAALFTELVAASVSALIGTYWGPLTLVSGLVQGLGAELVLLAFLYANWRVYVAMLAGAGAGLAAALSEFVIYYVGVEPAFMVVYAICFTISGAVIAGLGSWLLMRALAATGALSRFAAGRERTAEV